MDKKNKIKDINIRIEDSFKNDFKKKCLKEKISMSLKIRELILEYLNND